jgi:DNA-directed RNA polymerase specialized sigma24 family protein
MHDMRSNLRKCVGELSPDAREIVRLRYVENVRGAALAEVIGKPVNTVMVALSRINRRLAKCVRIKLALEAAS